MKQICSGRTHFVPTFLVERIPRRRSWPSSSMLISALVCLNFSLIGTASAQQKWGWFEALTMQNGWAILKGSADVKVVGGVFSAELYLEDGTLAVTLRGKIQDVRVDVTAVRHSTDDAPHKLTGSLKRISWQGGGSRESIILTEVGQPWGLTVGLTRELPTP